MAEAHQAVAFSFAITHDGLHVNYDREILHIIWHSGMRSWTRNFRRLVNNVKCGVFPGSLSSMMFTVGAFNSVYLTRDMYEISNVYGANGLSLFYKICNTIKEYLPIKNPTTKEVACCTIPAVGLWLGYAYVMKYTLRVLFLYKGWMYEQRGRGRQISWRSKTWLGIVNCLTRFTTPMLYSYQNSLPRLPLPSVKDTMRRYLRSVRPLLDDSNYIRMERLASEFENGIGRKFQRYLILKSWWATNYVSDWWEEFVYLRGRSPIMVNSNFYGTDAILIHPTTVQTARAANVCHSAFMFRRLIDRQYLKPIMVQGTVPLCSAQYDRTFNTTRIPGIEADRIVHFSDSTHIAVYHAGRYFSVPCYHKGVLLNPRELQLQFDLILADDTLPDKGEAQLGALTAGDRKSWAEARQRYFMRGVNRSSLESIERAAFVMIFENGNYDYTPDDPTQLDKFGRAMLHGKGYDRWFDKSFNIIVMNNGRVGFNAEHSWYVTFCCCLYMLILLTFETIIYMGDAAIMAHLWEHTMAEDVIKQGYDENGNCHGNVRFQPRAPSKLKWELNQGAQLAIDTSLKVAELLVNDVDLRLMMYKNYGKGFMKKCRVSPDAYIQMSLQLAYYRDAGKFNLTYEASMTRLFREGRTETVRPCTIESAAWAKAMNNDSVSDEEKVTLLRKACARHQLGYQDAMCGKGIDRHLFCLYVISKYLEVDSPFLNEVLSEPWRLSTSQTPHGQTNQLDLNKHPECISAGGGFGPVADDGYGVSYIIAGEDTLFFHISSKNSSSVTNSSTFARQIERSLGDIQGLFERVLKLPKTP